MPEIINTVGFPFTSVGGDRATGSGTWREYFDKLLTGHIVADVGNELEIKPQAVPNKSIYVDIGAVFIRGAMLIITSTETLSIADNVSGNPRIDRIVARINFAERKIELAVKQGSSSASPAPPSLIKNDSTYYEVSLAKLSLSNGFSTITSGDITSEREVESACGYYKYRGQDKFEKENNFSQYNKDVVTVDGNNMPNQVDYKRDDSTLAIRQVASNPDSNGYYQTVIETYYKEDGSTVYKTITYTLTFLANGIIDTSSKVVS